MKSFLIAVLTLLTLFMRLAGPLLIVPFALLFAKKTDAKADHHGQDPLIKRYVLPKFFKWLETPDEMLPGGLYEPTMLNIYNRYGWWVSSWIWLGFRNVCHGLWWPLGKEVPKKLREMSPEEQVDAGIHSTATQFLGLKILTGWKTVNDRYSTKTKGGIWAVPRVSVRLGD